MPLRFREITKSDIVIVAALLAGSFPRHSREFWHRGLTLLGTREVLPLLPAYGYLLEADNGVVGAILMINSEMQKDGAITPRCNLSSWCVRPEFRPYASLLASQALKHKEVTYLNVSPAPQTWPIIEAQGFSRYCDGSFISIPLLSGLVSRDKIDVLDACQRPAGVDQREEKMLLEHARYGCISLWCMTEEDAYPFIFRPRMVRRVFRGMQLIYCRDAGHFVRFAKQIGRYLALRGSFFVAIDANEPIAGLVGKFRRSAMPRYFKGPQRPRLGDLAYTEYALLGI